MGVCRDTGHCHPSCPPLAMRAHVWGEKGTSRHYGDADPPCVGSAEVTDPASIKAAAARVGEHLGGSGLNLLINNAGIVKPNSLDNETLEDMTQVYTTNTVGPLLLGQVRPPPPALQCSSREHPFLWPCLPELGCPRGHEGPLGEGPGSAPVLLDSH